MAKVREGLKVIYNVTSQELVIQTIADESS